MLDLNLALDNYGPVRLRDLTQWRAARSRYLRYLEPRFAVTKGSVEAMRGDITTRDVAA